MRSRVFRAAVVAAMGAALVLIPASASSAVSDPCGTGSNPIVCENSKPGTPRDDWYGESAWGEIEGFATRMSVQPGETLQLKVQSPTTFDVDVYRLGYYGGDGARRMPTSPASSFPARTQPACLHDAARAVTSSFPQPGLARTLKAARRSDQQRREGDARRGPRAAG